MKGAAKRGFVAVLTGLSIVVVASAKSHAQPPPTPAEVAGNRVTDQDRVFRNFTRESAVVEQGQIRVEVRALRHLALLVRIAVREQVKLRRLTRHRR